MSRAASSLPDPAAPEMRTRELAGPSFSMTRLRLAIADDEPTIRLTAPPRARRSLTSRLRRDVSSARSAIRMQPVGLERLLDEVVGAELDRRHRRLDVAVAGDHHHRHVRVLALDRLEQLQSVELRALQPDVEQDQLRPARFDRRDRLVGIARQPRPVALVLEDAGDEFADVVFVVDDQNVSSHQDEPILSFSAGAAMAFVAAQRQPHQHSGAPPAVGARQPVEKIDAAAVVLEDLDDDRQAEPGALGARRHVGLDQPVAVLASESPCRCR